MGKPLKEIALNIPPDKRAAEAEKDESLKLGDVAFLLEAQKQFYRALESSKVLSDDDKVQARLYLLELFTQKRLDPNAEIKEPLSVILNFITKDPSILSQDGVVESLTQYAKSIYLKDGKFSDEADQDRVNNFISNLESLKPIVKVENSKSYESVVTYTKPAMSSQEALKTLNTATQAELIEAGPKVVEAYNQAVYGLNRGFYDGWTRARSLTELLDGDEHDPSLLIGKEDPGAIKIDSQIKVLEGQIAAENKRKSQSSLIEKLPILFEINKLKNELKQLKTERAKYKKVWVSDDYINSSNAWERIVTLEEGESKSPNALKLAQDRPGEIVTRTLSWTGGDSPRSGFDFARIRVAKLGVSGSDHSAEMFSALHSRENEDISKRNYLPIGLSKTAKGYEIKLTEGKVPLVKKCAGCHLTPSGKFSPVPKQFTDRTVFDDYVKRLSKDLDDYSKEYLKRELKLDLEMWSVKQ